LWATDQLVLEKDKTGKLVTKLSKGLNQESGKESTKAHAFGEANWGPASRRYLKSINNLRAGSMESIIKNAQVFAKSGRRSELQDSMETDTFENDDEDDDERANLVDYADESDDDGSIGEFR
jgi:hypothetical protein